MSSSDRLWVIRGLDDGCGCRLESGGVIWPLSGREWTLGRESGSGASADSLCFEQNNHVNTTLVRDNNM